MRTQRTLLLAHFKYYLSLVSALHSNNWQAMMFAFYDDDIDSLQQDDIDGIQALYGLPSGS